ncbi:9127_t:CDS:2 [Scutellospora calospora]|uniref:9127_t:CDS:1 n=1 Tax=Scutellospora calospora TaxID=85575 RepID=A0ACA9KFZ8_9GLOM|nr:9127_t:CDS:2 [Scutellospora calospora]
MEEDLPESGSETLQISQSGEITPAVWNDFDPGESDVSFGFTL